MAMTFKANYISLGLALLLAMAVSGSSIAQRTYTTSADFLTGTLQGVECASIPDQLQLVPDDCRTQSFLWAPNENGTISKVCATTGKELGRYRVVPPELPELPYSGEQNFGWPSRTTVCSDGSCWVANRTAGTVVKIGLVEAGQWIDRNNDGIVQTSTDINGDGDISDDEILPWGEDECVLYEVVLVARNEGVYYPGTYTGPYDPDDGRGTSPCALAKDENDDIWVGSKGRNRFFHITGAQPPALPSMVTIDQQVNVAPHRPFGAAIDRFGAIWSVGRDEGDVVRIDPTTDPATIDRLPPLPHMAYGLALDKLDHLFVTGYTTSMMSRIDIVNKTVDWSKSLPGLVGSRGVACTDDNDVWVANSGIDNITRYDNSGVLKATIDETGAEPSGVSVDVDGNVWVCNRMDEHVIRINPETNAFDINKKLLLSVGHYAYSDMNGSIHGCVATNEGVWTVVYDSKENDTIWDKVSWNDQPGNPDSGEYEGATLAVSVQSSSDLVSFSDVEIAVNGAPLAATPMGRYLKVTVNFERTPGAPSPVLYDLTITPISEPQVKKFKLLQAYPGGACEPIRKFAGVNGFTGPDVITAVPGVLSFDPGGSNWSNFVTAAQQNKPYTVTNTSLRKVVPEYVCTTPIGGKSVLQQGYRGIRTWWPLMYELPGTNWTLTISYKLDDAPYTTEQDIWTWEVDATLDSLEGIIRLFHQLPAGSCQVPLISSETLYNRLLDDIDRLRSMDPSDPAMAELFNEFILLVENNCVTVGCGECVAELGIRNTLENPACCKILADADYIADALGVFKW